MSRPGDAAAALVKQEIARARRKAGPALAFGLAGVLLGIALLALAIVALAPWLQLHYGIGLTPAAPSATQWGLLGAVLAAGFLASLVPGWRAYRLSLADGLSPRH